MRGKNKDKPKIDHKMCKISTVNTENEPQRSLQKFQRNFIIWQVTLKLGPNKRIITIKAIHAYKVRC